MNIIKIKKYGWKRGLPDYRAPRFNPKLSVTSLPPMVDLRAQCPAVYDQSNLGSCTANGIGGLVEFVEMKEGHPAFVPSRLFIYYNERVIEGSVNEDAGASLHDGMSVVAELGAPDEVLWPYDISKFTVKPTPNVFADGLAHKVTNYFKVNNTNLDDMRSCLAEGYPVVGGFTVYNSFESPSVASSGIVPMPGNRDYVVGGHAILVVGYDDSKSWFIVRNSWGAGWGDKGYFYIPYLYFTNPGLADDFWTVRSVL